MPYEIIQDLCTGCGKCEPVCPVEAIIEAESYYIINSDECCECIGYSEEILCLGECQVEGAIRRIPD